MEVKGQLIEAQAELKADTSASKKGQISYDTTKEALVVGDGTVGKHLQSGFLGEVKSSFLTEAEVQADWGAGWILCDGRNVIGSDYNTAFGRTVVPDMRGIFFRGKNNGRADGNENPAGDQALETYEVDQANTVKRLQTSQPAGFQPTGFIDLPLGGGFGTSKLSGGFDGSNVNLGGEKFGYGEEARVKSVTGNYFIKINR